MPAFDPDKFLQETAPVAVKAPFDPDKFLAETGTHAQPAPAESPHDLVPFLKQQGSNMADMVGNAASGLGHAVMNPGETASNVANSLASSPEDYLSGAYRAVRSIPIVGDLVDSTVANAKAAGHDVHNILSGGHDPEAGERAITEHKQAQAQSDKEHAEKHPLTDFIQKSVGLTALPGGMVAPVATLAADAFKKSLANGSDSYTALADARNSAILATMAFGAGHAVSSGVNKLASGATKAAGVSDEAIANYTQPAPMEAPPVEAPPLQPEALPDPFARGTGHAMAQAGKNLGATIGATATGLMTHNPAAAIAGGFVGRSIGEIAGGLADTYGAPAVKLALDTGIQIDKLANTPYIGPLMQAAANGPKSLAVAHYMMSQTTPEYQALTSSQK